MDISVVPIPCLKDNYAYLVTRAGASDALVVDACESAPIERELVARGLTLRAILSTHHHRDHVGGNDELVKQYGVPVLAHRSDMGRVPKLSHPLGDGESFEIAGFHGRAWHIPAHTRGALAYAFSGVCFTGDTLFAGGAGRLFEGTPEELYRALYMVLGRMDGATVLCTGHEYTERNLEFAAFIEPDNASITTRLSVVRAARVRGEPTAVTTLSIERDTNPFLRADRPEVLARLGMSPGSPPAEVLRRLRELKDHF